MCVLWYAYIHVPCTHWNVSVMNRLARGIYLALTEMKQAPDVLESCGPPLTLADIHAWPQERLSNTTLKAGDFAGGMREQGNR